MTDQISNHSDHRYIGSVQELFMFSKYAPGSCFFLPHGMRIYNKLLNLIKSQYWKRGFQEIKTPILCKSDLWKISGQWDKYCENMFCLELDNTNYAMAPINCPKHCLMYQHRPRLYQDLPIRWADCGALHRNEEVGSLSGLSRVRMFCQDDAHIFCAQDQIKNEIINCLDFLIYIYKIFGFKYKMTLSTRPKEKLIGTDEIWTIAEKQLSQALTEKFGDDWSINEGDGPIYGPKIDIMLQDAHLRLRQCGTIQLDFNLPERFELKYIHGEQALRPVMIHRAIYGSFERFIGILIEHYGGKFPFWLSPRQIVVASISEKTNTYASEIRNILHNEGFYIDVDISDNRINKKIKDAQIENNFYYYIIVVGEKEMNNQTINIRGIGEKSITDAIVFFHKKNEINFI